MRLPLLLSLLILLTSCATTNYYEQTIDSWRSHKSRDLTAKWGQPNQVIKHADGTQVWVYMTQHPFGFGNMRYKNTVFVVNGQAIGAQVPDNRYGPPPAIRCTTVYTLNKQGVITSAHYQGNNCIGPSAHTP